MMMNEVQAFRAVTLFLDQFTVHGGNDLFTLISDVALASDGPRDPAAWDDWMEGVRTVNQEAHPRPAEGTIAKGTRVTGERLDECQAFRVMTLFLDRFTERGGRDLLALIHDVTPGPSGAPCDPRVWEDWITCFRAVLDEPMIARHQ